MERETMERYQPAYLTQEYLGAFFNAMTEGFAHHEILCDENGNPVDFRFMDINRSFERITGLSREKVIGKTVRELIPEIGPEWVEVYGRVALTGEAATFENHERTLGKHFRVIAFSHQKGQFSVLFIDITDLKKTNNELNKYKLLMENSKDIILFISREGAITEANYSAIAAYGYPKEELIGKRIRDIRSPDFFEGYEEQIGIAFRQGISFETVHRRKDGSEFPVEVSSKSAEIEGETVLISIIRDISVRKQTERELIYLANHDSLTGISNRNYLMNHIVEVIENANRVKDKFALLLFDINKFKNINDTYGHIVGDEVLKETARRVKNGIRSVDTIARIGGDEFVVIQQHVGSRDGIERFAQKILDLFREPITSNGQDIFIATSIGIAVYPDDGTSRRVLMINADKAMYSAKETCNHCYRFYSEDFVDS